MNQMTLIREVMEASAAVKPRVGPKFTGTVQGTFRGKPHLWHYANGRRIRGEPLSSRQPRANSKASAASKPVSKMQQQAAEIVGNQLEETTERAFIGKPIESKEKLSKQLAGAIGEQIIIQWLKDNGFADAGFLSDYLQTERNNLPADLLHDHQLIEAKTGQSSNSQQAQQWRLTIGEPGNKEKELLKGMSDEEKATYNQRKQQAIHGRKEKALQEMAEELGFPVKIKTMTVILNPDTKTADLYQFDGVHDRIGWNSDMAKAGYVGSVKYGVKTKKRSAPVSP